MTPTATPQATGNWLFRDDFQTYSNRWRTQHSAKAVVEYSDATLRVRVISPGVWAWSVPDFDVSLRNCRLAAIATFYEGTTDSVFGLVLGHQDDSNFYVWGLTMEGAWFFWQQRDGAWLDLTPTDARPLHLTNDQSNDQQTFNLQAEVTGSEVSFYVDARLAGVVRADPERLKGRFGVFARAGKGYIDVAFDDIVVVDQPEINRP